MPVSDQQLFHELSFYTLAQGQRTGFIHQLIVDAYMAQHGDENTKRIAIVFALVGLYLCVEKGFTGRQVQRVHMALAKTKDTLPTITLPIDRGNISIVDVIAAEDGTGKDEMIKKWCASVWDAYKSVRPVIINYLQDNSGLLSEFAL